MLHRLHHHDPLVVEVKAQPRESVGREGLLADMGQHHVDPVGLDPGGGSEPGAAAAEAALAVILREAAHGNAQVHRIARGDAALAADAQQEGRAEPRLVADPDRAGIPDQTERHVPDAAFGQTRQDRGVVGGRAGAGIVGEVGQHHRARVVGGQSRVDAGIDAVAAARRLLAHRPDLPGEVVRQRLGLGGVAIGYDQHLRADIRNVAPGEAVPEGDRQDAVPPLQRLHPAHEARDRLAGGAPHIDHPAIGIGHHGPDVLGGRAHHQRVEVAGAVDDVGVGVFLVDHDDVGAPPHRLGEMAVQVELDADRRVRADDGADPLQGVALAIVVALGDHGTVHEQQHGIDRHRGPEVVEQGVAQLLVDDAQGDPARLREGREALDDLMLVRLGQRAPGLQTDIAEAGRRLAAVATGIIGQEGRAAGGQRCEGVGLGGQSGDEDLQGRSVLVFGRPPVRRRPGSA